MRKLYADEVDRIVNDTGHFNKDNYFVEVSMDLVRSLDNMDNDERYFLYGMQLMIAEGENVFRLVRR